jgi:iron complex outermembrane receptor protein
MPLLNLFSVKTFFITLLAGFLSITAAAQQNDLWKEDSSKTIQLTEIVVHSKTPAHYTANHYYKLNGAATLEEMMSRVPQLSLVRRGSYGMEPTIRSFNGGQINVLIDGMRIYGACTDKMDPATIYIEPVNLENLQVQTGMNGFVNGSSIGGTVNMKMAEPEYNYNKKLKGFISSGYQTAAQSIYQGGVLNYSSGKWGFRATGTYRNNQPYRSGGGTIIPFSQFEKINYSFTAKYKYNRFISFKADVLADDGWNIGYPALPMDVGYAAARITSLTMQYENKNKHLYQLMMKAYANSIRHFMDDSKRPNVPIHMDMPGWSKAYGWISEAALRIGSNQQLQVRADITVNDTKASMTMYKTGQLPMYMLTWPDNRRIQSGISASWLMQADSSLSFQLNTRTDYISYELTTQDAKDQLSTIAGNKSSRGNLLGNASIRATKVITGNLKFNGGISFSERMPSASELYGFYLFNRNDNHDYIGNLQLKKEQSLQAEISIHYQLKKHRWQFTAYHSKVYQYINNKILGSYSAMTIGAAGVKTFINLPYANLTGMEASVSVQATEKIAVFSTVRYLYARDNQQNPLPFIAPLKNISSVRVQVKNLLLQLEYEAAAAQYRFNVNAGEDATPGYLLLHARIAYNFNKVSLPVAINAGIENIMDKNYWEHLDWGNIPRPGRNIYLQLKLSF